MLNLLSDNIIKQREIVTNLTATFLSNLEEKGITINEQLTEYCYRRLSEQLIFPDKIIRCNTVLTKEVINEFLQGNRRLLNRLQDIMQYYNNCLNLYHRHQIFMFMNSDQLLNQQAINEFTSKPYTEADFDSEDPYIQLFFYKYIDLSREQFDEINAILSMHWALQTEKLIDCSNKMSVMAYSETRLTELADVLELIKNSTSKYTNDINKALAQIANVQEIINNL